MIRYKSTLYLGEKILAKKMTENDIHGEIKNKNGYFDFLSKKLKVNFLFFLWG